MYRGLLVLAITIASSIASSVASAHVAPSVDDNNRYIKVTPAADRVRVAYTVFFGEVPGAQMRRSLDADHDGLISDAEGDAFAHKLAGEVADSLVLDVDGKPQPVSWSTVAIGLGSPQTAAGSFSVDLIAWVCLPSVRGKHAVLLHDRFRLTRPGETELKVEDSPGIAIDHARIGHADDPSYDYRFAGPGGPLQDDGLDLAFTVGDKAPLTSGGSCTASTSSSGPTSHGKLVVIVVGGAVLAIGAGVLVMRRGRRRARRVA